MHGATIKIGDTPRVSLI